MNTQPEVPRKRLAPARTISFVFLTPVMNYPASDHLIPVMHAVLNCFHLVEVENPHVETGDRRRCHACAVILERGGR